MLRTHKAWTCRLGLLAVAACTPFVAAAQSQRLYLTDANGGAAGLLSIGQFGSVTNINAGTNGAYAIAAGTSVYTMGAAQYVAGRQFDLSGNPLGPTYSNTGVADKIFFDGTTSGAYNYAVTWTTSGNGEVYRANTDWTSLTPLFNVTGTTLSITYDAGHNSLWVGNWTGPRTMFEYALDGTLLNTVSLGGSGQVAALAYDSSDQTLWASSYSGDGVMTQYNRSGTVLSSVDYGNQSWVGGEFSDGGEEVEATPEPATLMLLATGLLAIGGVARRRRSSL